MVIKRTEENIKNAISQKPPTSATCVVYQNFRYNETFQTIVEPKP